MEESKLMVIDASIIIKWLLEEQNGMEQAEKIQDDLIERNIKILIPGHCYMEVANTISRKAPELALNFISKLKVSTIREQILNISKITLALDLMKKYKKISFYDAAYHALAISEGATFVTADEKYYETTKEQGNIILLQNYC